MRSNYNEEKVPEIHTIRGKSLDECKNKLNKSLNGNYEIIDWRTVEEQGLFKVKMEVEAKYITKLKPSVPSDEKKSFAQNQTDILKTLTQGKDISNVQEIARLGKQISQIQQQLNAGLNKIYEDSVEHEVHKNITKMEELLRANEFTESYILKMREKMKSLSLELLDDFDMVQKKVVDWIGESVNVAKKTVHRPPHVIVIVGPTGVGKTTTIAKLGIKIRLENSRIKDKDPLADEKVVKYMTTDRMRIGAFEQLSKWVHAIQDEDEEVLVAEDADELKKLFNQYKESSDYFLIDTSGFSPNDHENIGKMLSLFEVKSLHADINLAVSANTKTSDLKKILQNYEPFAYQNVIVTKCDETTSLGSVISVLSEKNKSVSYVTTGQNPSEIEEANPIFFLRNLDGFTIDRDHLEEKFGKAQDK